MDTGNFHSASYFTEKSPPSAMIELRTLPVFQGDRRQGPVGIPNRGRHSRRNWLRGGVPSKKLFQFSEQSGGPHWFYQRIRVVNRIRREMVLTKAGNDDD